METHLALIPAIVGAALIVIASERIQPHSPFWTRSHGDARTDLTHLFLSQLLPPPLVDLALGATVGVLSVQLAGSGGPSWPSDLPFALQLTGAAIIGEFGQYWWHRACHQSPWLWRFHATHHSAPRLWWLNAGRFHPLDTVFAHTLTMAPLILIGCPGEIVAGMAVLTAVHGLFQHANIDLRLGPLNWVFSMAELHRWHHSRNLDDANKNYGANIIFWDIVFGTRHLPADRVHDPRDVGFNGVDAFPQTYLGQVGSIIRWSATQDAVAAASDAESER
jgi:sterol desaturase/sphingolipid hydroxylase (fatty acid hydroxylase superfamily)